MSTQEESGIALSIDPEQQSFRLLELPPQLLELVTSSTPPILYLKSEPTRSSTNGDTGPNAYVCTNDHTFEVRQVQSSNLLYVVQPSGDVASAENEGSILPGISVIGQCKAFLELVPAPTAATKFLEQVLPVFDDSHPVPGDHSTKRDLLADAPFSAGEFEAAWMDICAFESNPWSLGRRAWRPSAPLVLDHWKYFMSAVTVDEIDPTSLFSVNDVANSMQEEGHSLDLLRAMLQRVSSTLENAMVLLDPEKCVSWVGAVLLEARFDGISIASSAFMTMWQDLLPEMWRAQVSLDLLAGLYIDLGDSQIQFKAEKPPPNQQAAPPAPVTNAKSASKWHARLKSNQ
ncbi:hypothetical protein MMC30_002713 [Trapelia coarctata]|nr:hypothetical protein [Trapelia coarctata]